MAKTQKKKTPKTQTPKPVSSRTPKARRARRDGFVAKMIAGTPNMTNQAITELAMSEGVSTVGMPAAINAARRDAGITQVARSTAPNRAVHLNPDIFAAFCAARGIDASKSLAGINWKDNRPVKPAAKAQAPATAHPAPDGGAPKTLEDVAELVYEIMDAHGLTRVTFDGDGISYDRKVVRVVHGRIDRKK